jgi:hypothetical protein
VHDFIVVQEILTLAVVNGRFAAILIFKFFGLP